MANKMSPHEFCLRYAVGCLDARHARGDVSSEDYQALLEMAQRGDEPPAELMRRCFPRLYKEVGPSPTLRKVQRYWRIVHQGPDENTPVSRATVKRLAHKDERGEWWHVRYYDWKTGRMKDGIACNTCGLPLEPSHLVYLHSGTIAEFAPVND